MFWDHVASLYDLYENLYNGKVNAEFPIRVAGRISSTDDVLECACGTGMITQCIAPRCKSVVATDLSDGMLAQAAKKCADFSNVAFIKADICNLQCADASFDKVVAGNVIHLLDDPKMALNELMRVCKPGGMLIIPTYVNYDDSWLVKGFLRMLEMFGAKFKLQFTYKSYQQFFADMGLRNVEFELVEGRMPCSIAFIRK